MRVPEQRYHAWMSVQLLIIVVIRRFDHGVLLIIRSQSDDRGRKLLLITRVLSLDEFSVPLLLATRVQGHPSWSDRKLCDLTDTHRPVMCDDRDRRRDRPPWLRRHHDVE